MEEAKIDLRMVLEASRSFLRTHELGILAKELPAAITLPEDRQRRFEQALAEGFGSAFVFPSVASQKVHFEEILKHTAATPVFGLPRTEQYTPAFTSELRTLKTALVRNRPSGAYLLLYRSGPFPRETRDKKAAELDRLFESLGWQGLSITEYLILQRVLCEKHNDHRFDLYAPDVARSQWMWLLDTRLREGVVMAFWNPRACRVELGVSDDETNARRGAHPTVVIQI